MPTLTEQKPITCRAAVCWEPKASLVVETIEVAPPKRGEVRIKMVAASVCHMDLMMGKGYTEGGKFPIILGHEGAGIVESIGPAVDSVRPGDRVIPLWVPRCRECRFCNHPSGSNYCNAIDTLSRGVLIDGTSRFNCNGHTIYHFKGTSTFSEYTVVPEICVAKIDPKAPLDKVCLLSCGVSTGYGAALNTANVKPDSDVAIWGLGCIGLGVAFGCKERGAQRIIGIDIIPSKVELAGQFGVTDFVNPMQLDRPVQEALMEATDGGLDYTFECVGNVDTMRIALESTRRGCGLSVVTLGIGPREKQISIKPLQLLRGRTWKGSLFGGWRGRDDVPKLVQKCMEGELVLDALIKHRITIEGLNDAFCLLNRGEYLGIVVNILN